MIVNFRCWTTKRRKKRNTNQAIRNFVKRTGGTTNALHLTGGGLAATEPTDLLMSIQIDQPLDFGVTIALAVTRLMAFGKFDGRKNSFFRR